MIDFRLLPAAVLCALMALGCGSPVQPETIPVKAENDPLNAPRSILKAYANGQELGSEVASYPKMVADVKKVDSARGDILEKGLQEIQDAPAANRPELAKTLLTKIQPAMK
ncbi:MAG TPA: hypothetical protein VFE62_09100 [Gemmataceae bacterium]|nr:hypothetical protein [Gemmataceae bacterium]